MMELFGLEDIIFDGMDSRSLESSKMVGFKSLVGIAKLPVSLPMSFPRIMSKVKESSR